MKSLKTFMQGTGKTTEEGVVIEVKLGQIALSRHEFTLEQMGEECILIQAWLGQITLEQGLERAVRRRVVEVLDELATLETVWLADDSARFRIALRTTFGVNLPDKDWLQEWTIHWKSGKRQLSWEARARR